MIDALLVTAVTSLSKPAAEILIKAFKEYLRRKGQPISDSPTEEEVVKSLAALEDREPSKVAIAGAQNAFADAASRLGTYHSERERQARNSYNLAWVILGAGSAIVIAGVAWMALGAAVTPGVITSGVGAITSLCSGAVFKFANDANDRLDDLARNLHKIETARLSLEIVQRISNDDERNAAITQIVDSLNHLQSAGAHKKSFRRVNPKKGSE